MALTGPGFLDPDPIAIFQNNARREGATNKLCTRRRQARDSRDSRREATTEHRKAKQCKT
eukprot:1169975-Pyramimonas_sp.AAC.1